MTFDELDQKLRVYETAYDFCVPPGSYMTARIDGRGFTRLTKETHPFEAPFDTRFRDYMVETAEHLMNCGFHVCCGYTQSDEISLLFHSGETLFGRKLRKYESILAGEASARFSLLLGDIGVFDCRLSLLPNRELVVDYFRWRQADAHRNALNAHCYWLMRKSGQPAAAATQFLKGRSAAEKNDFLFQHGINFNDVPNWQKRGVGLYWEPYEKTGFDPVTQKEVTAVRRRLKVEMELPIKDAYIAWMEERIQ